MYILYVYTHTSIFVVMNMRMCIQRLSENYGTLELLRQHIDQIIYTMISCDMFRDTFLRQYTFDRMPSFVNRNNNMLRKGI